MKLENVADIYPLSPVQVGMLFHTLAAANSGVYIEQYTCKIQGQLQEKAFKSAWEKVIERHETLRTALVWEGLDEPLQIVRQKVELPWAFQDWQKLNSQQQERQFTEFLEKDRILGFPLEKAPLIRITLIRLEENVYQLVWTFHHLLCDGWSTLIILKEVFALYDSLFHGKNISLSSPRPYRDYIAWLQQQDLNKAKLFWQKTLKGFSEATPLPTTNITSKKSSHNYQQQQISLNPQISESLNSWARQNRLTLNTLINGAWTLLLGRCSGKEEVVYGTTVSGRPTNLSGVEDMVGLFLNTLPVRVQISPQQELIPWLQEIQFQLLNLRAFEYTPLVKIQTWSEVPQGNSLFESLVVFENFPSQAQIEDSSLKIDDAHYLEQSNYPLVLKVFPQKSLELILIYDADRFESEIVAKMLSSLQTILSGFVENPHSTVSSLPVLSEAEKNQLLVEWNQSSTIDYQDICIDNLIKEQVEKNPDGIAVTFGHQNLTYRELYQKANILALHLQSLGVGADVCVGILSERSLEMIVGILGILIAGGAYIPLDPDYPQERLTYILEDTEAVILLTQQSLVDLLPNNVLPTLCLDTDWQKIEESNDSKSPITKLKSNEHLAYVIYTSGSTGKPKGVLVTHRNLVHSTTARIKYYTKNVDRFLLLSSFAFDSSVAGIFWTLCQGGTLVLPKQKLEQDLEELANIITQEKITHILCLPSLYSLLLDYSSIAKLESLQVVIVAGETCGRSLAKQHHDKLPDTFLYNEYGPTEGTVWSTVYQVPPNLESSTISIGKPIPNTQIYLLNAHQQLSPIGVEGEIYIGGAGVVRGYLNQPQKTSEQFIPNPFSQVEGDRLYRTGDLARYLPDGNLEFLGRVDRQVKIRGYRIELGEIEDVLRNHEIVEEVVVVAQSIIQSSSSNQDHLRLVGYVVPHFSVTDLDPSLLQDYLKAKLPNYMIPAGIMFLEAFPRTANGKIDNKALPELQSTIFDSDKLSLPQTSIEKTLAEIWSQVLGLETIGIHDNFFELGGDSILSIQITSKARETGLRLSPNHLFEQPTIAELATVVNVTAEEISTQVPVTGLVPLTPIQHWFFEQGMIAPHHWHQAMLLEIPVEVSVSAIQEAIAILWSHHDALRLSFKVDSTGWHQTNNEVNNPPSLAEIDISHLSEIEQIKVIAKYGNNLYSSVKLSDGKLMGVAHFNRGANLSSWLLISLHHLVVDAISWQILHSDLEKLLSQRGDSKQLLGKTTSFKNWAEILMDQALERQSELDFWLGQVEPPFIHLPRDYSNTPLSTEATAGIVTVKLDVDDTKVLLQSVPTMYNTQINDILLSALAKTLLQWIGVKDGNVRIDLEAYGREQIVSKIDLSRTIGWLTILYPLKLELTEGDDYGVMIKSIKEQVRQIRDHGISYGILRYLGNETIRQRLTQAEKSEVLFNYLGQLNRTSGGGSLKIIQNVSLGQLRDLGNCRSYLLEINAWVTDGQLQLNWIYDQQVYKSNTISKIANNYLNTLKAMIIHCTTSDNIGFTSSDFPDADLSQAELDEFIDNI